MTKIAGSGSRIRIRIHQSDAWIRESGSGSTPKCHGSATLMLRMICGSSTYRFGTNNVTSTPVLRIRYPGWVKNQDLDPGSESGMNIPDHISASLAVFWVKNTQILWCIYGSGIRNLFDLDPGWKNSDPGSGINIPDPQHCSTQLTTFMFRSPDVSSCRYWLRSEQLLVWLEALAAAGVVWLKTLAAACLVWGLNSCRYGLRPENKPVWSELRSFGSEMLVWFDVWAAAGMDWGLSSCRYCSREVGAGYLYGSISSSCLYCLRLEQLPVWFGAWVAPGIVWGLPDELSEWVEIFEQSIWFEVRAAVDMEQGLASCQYGLRPKQLPIGFEAWGAAVMLYIWAAAYMVWHPSSCLYDLRSVQLSIWFEAWAAAT